MQIGRALEEHRPDQAVDDAINIDHDEHGHSVRRIRREELVNAAPAVIGSAPTTGMNEPRKTSAEKARALGRPRIKHSKQHQHRLNETANDRGQNHAAAHSGQRMDQLIGLRWREKRIAAKKENEMSSVDQEERTGSPSSPPERKKQPGKRRDED